MPCWLKKKNTGGVTFNCRDGPVDTVLVLPLRDMGSNLKHIYWLSFHILYWFVGDQITDGQSIVCPFATFQK